MDPNYTLLDALNALIMANKARDAGEPHSGHLADAIGNLEDLCRMAQWWRYHPPS